MEGHYVHFESIGYYMHFESIADDLYVIHMHVSCGSVFQSNMSDVMKQLLQELYHKTTRAIDSTPRDSRPAWANQDSVTHFVPCAILRLLVMVCELE